MDKKNTIIGVSLLLAAFAVLYFAPRSAPPTTAPGGEKSAPGSPTAPAVTPSSTPTPSQQSTPPPASAVTAAFAAVSHEAASATVTTLANDFIEARFTDSGGALRDVALKKYAKVLGSPAPFIFNELHADPILAFVELQGLDRNTKFERVSQTADEIVYRAVFNGNLEVTRRYKLSPNSAPNSDPYQIKHETTFRNLTEQTLPGMHVSLSLGTAAPTNADDPADQLATGFSTGKDREFLNRASLEPSGGFLGIVGSHGAKPALISSGPFTWTCVKNQFFTSIFTAEPSASQLVTRRVKLLNALPDDDRRAYGVTGAAQFEVKALGKGAETKLTGSLYVGPKEYRRLANTDVFKADEDKVMNFGFFKFFSQILLTLMTWIHSFTHNWGVAIILTTLTLKTIFIPFTLAASKSAKRMAKLQPEMQALREKYKDNPQKQQQATMELFKTHKVNPVGGCFPVLITIPFFMGFFTMLRTAAELRFQSFLWAPDLSAPDTIAVLFGMLPLNIMPILMGSTMIIQMHLTPTPSVDNAQVKMMKFMPYMFALFCYNFSCALSLYSFVNGLFTIGQQLVINRMKDAPGGPASPSAAAASTASSWKRGTKNVTPKKK
jgi:YidC/Oxa1 family membrane protein insertase